MSRAARVETNQDNIYTLLNQQQREFVSYVLRNYVKMGVDELDVGKLSTVLNAKYGSIHAAQRELGSYTRYNGRSLSFSSSYTRGDLEFLDYANIILAQQLHALTCNLVADKFK